MYVDFSFYLFSAISALYIKASVVKL